MLSEAGISAGAFSVLSLKPLPSEQIKTISKQCHTIITMEEHNVVGGLGGAIAEAISEIDGPHSTLYRFGLQDCFTSEIGNQKYLRDYYNISAEKIFKYLMEHKNK